MAKPASYFLKARIFSPDTGGGKKPPSAAFLDGYFRTGDLAIRSADGYYTLCGRKSDLIISGGFNIYPREIEEFLEEQEGVAEAAVAAAPDRVRGEVPDRLYRRYAAPGRARSGSTLP